MAQSSDVQERIKSYILREVLEGASPSDVTNTTPLITAGILDSIATLKLVGFLEQEFSISIDAQDIDPDTFETIDHIAELVRSITRHERAHAPPEEALEIQIAEIWQRLLKTDQIGIDDDFFGAGGDSLLAEQMLLEVESVINHEIPASALSKASTIRGLAAIAVSGSDGRLLTKVRDAPGTPFFFCHGDFGSRGFYALKLARLIDPPRPVYLIHSLRDVDESTDLSIEAMAHLYVPLLLAARPEGPFRLGGHCNGGLLALEIANQLTRLGREVELVLLIESISINCRWPLRLANRVIRGLGAIVPSAKYRRRLARDGMLFVWEIFEFGLICTAQEIVQQHRRSSPYLRAIAQQDRRSPAYLRAMANYIPPKLNCTVVAIIAETSTPDSKLLPRSWKSRAKIVRHATVPGDHLGCITIELAALATRVSSFLEGS